MRENGFSLIEMLAVIAIVVVLISVTVLNFGETRDLLSLRRAAHQLMQDVRRVQDMAMSATELNGEGNCLLPAKGYGIYIDYSVESTSYELYADTSADTGLDCETYPPTECWEYYDSEDCVIETIFIQEKGVIIKEIKNTIIGAQKVSINFKPPNPAVKIKWLLPEADEVEIVLALESDQTKTESVVVNKAGLLQIRTSP
ncbi:type II secretion system GspH family protein [Patescibacteria group bacterium]|nr:type II secretion system GspH family protein [Patescibacteria group bacterium]